MLVSNQMVMASDEQRRWGGIRKPVAQRTEVE